MTRPVARSTSPPRRGGKGGNPGAKATAKAKAAPAAASDGSSAPTDAQKPKTEAKFGGLKTMWCAAYLKGKCPYSDDECVLPHISQETKAQIQAKIDKGVKAGRNKM